MTYFGALWSWPMILSIPSRLFHAYSCPDNLCQFASKSVYSFSKYRVYKLGNRRTDERTDGHVENIMPPASLNWRRHKNRLTVHCRIVFSSQPTNIYRTNTLGWLIVDIVTLYWYSITVVHVNNRVTSTASVLLVDYVTTGDGLKNGVHCGL